MKSITIAISDDIYDKLSQYHKDHEDKITLDVFISTFLSDSIYRIYDKKYNLKKPIRTRIGKHGSKRRKTKLSVKIHWDTINKGKPEQILKNNNALTLKYLIERLYEEMGENILDNLAQFKTSRGHILSKKPSIDFINKKTGKQYGNHRIKDTGYYVLTHSSTDEKLDCINDLTAFLRLPNGFIEVNSESN